jgi:aldehyde dehydrogenase (NAD+)
MRSGAPDPRDEALTTGTLAGLPDAHFIDGAWATSSAGRTMDSVDPGSGNVFARFAAGDAVDIDAAVSSARKAFAGEWRRMAPAARGRILANAAAMLRAKAERFAVVESLDSGKRLVEARGDVAGAARAFEYYAGACDKTQGDSIPLGPDYLAYTTLEPVGVTAQIVPWNYPISTLARGVAPALAAGNCVVAKPAEQTPMTALMLAELLRAAGLPPGVFNVVTGTGKDAGAPLVAHPGIDHITFTGSVVTGQSVMRAAAANVTRLVLELGGKSPLVVLDDADLDAAVEGVLGGIYENAGQICSAASRLIVDRRIHAAMLERLVARVAKMKLSHGLGDADMGPLISPEQRARVAGFVDRARARGVSIACGGRAATDPETGLGWFYEPTILDALKPDDEAVTEEIFGPVLAVQIADDADHAVALANGTRYALVAGVYTRDFARAHRLAAAIDAGQVYINEYFAGGIETPFGGNRHSGFGREKGLEALRSYAKLKSVAARIG